MICQRDMSWYVIWISDILDNSRIVISVTSAASSRSFLANDQKSSSAVTYSPNGYVVNYQSYNTKITRCFSTYFNEIFQHFCSKKKNSNFHCTILSFSTFLLCFDTFNYTNDINFIATFLSSDFAWLLLHIYRLIFSKLANIHAWSSISEKV